MFFASSVNLPELRAMTIVASCLLWTTAQLYTDATCSRDQQQNCRQAVMEGRLDQLPGGGECINKPYVQFTHLCIVDNYLPTVDYCCCSPDQNKNSNQQQLHSNTQNINNSNQRQRLNSIRSANDNGNDNDNEYINGRTDAGDASDSHASAARHDVGRHGADSGGDADGAAVINVANNNSDDLVIFCCRYHQDWNHFRCIQPDDRVTSRPPSNLIDDLERMTLRDGRRRLLTICVPLVIVGVACLLVTCVIIVYRLRKQATLRGGKPAAYDVLRRDNEPSGEEDLQQNQHQPTIQQQLRQRQQIFAEQYLPPRDNGSFPDLISQAAKSNIPRSIPDECNQDPNTLLPGSSCFPFTPSCRSSSSQEPRHNEAPPKALEPSAPSLDELGLSSVINGTDHVAAFGGYHGASSSACFYFPRHQNCVRIAQPSTTPYCAMRLAAAAGQPLGPAGLLPSSIDSLSLDEGQHTAGTRQDDTWWSVNNPKTLEGQQVPIIGRLAGAQALTAGGLILHHNASNGFCPGCCHNLTLSCPRPVYPATDLTPCPSYSDVLLLPVSYYAPHCANTVV